ncbi:hypothetical protein JOC37_002040 [Desulfohalotomaculum tongense]|uniref:hypothetical protein n=1 Tax=Desulforadius tongensis TaxID=1216062 RepID=UPI0019566413|nr:hypothetical protein [Desulforadius tongensis]MBM7855638.1 hypothetical protein [Desulforadius tongensis]
MHLSLDELLKKAKEMRKLLLNIKNQLLNESTFDRLLVLVCMGKGGFLPIEALPNHTTMSLICESSELFEQILPYLDQQFLYQCMDKATKAEMMQCVNTVRQNNIAKTVRDEHYFKALTILYQVLFETIVPNNDLWDEFTYRLVARWNKFNKEFIQAMHH